MHRVMRRLTLLVLLGCCAQNTCAASAATGQTPSNTTLILNSLRKYANPKVRPFEDSDTRLYVNVSMHVQHLRAPNEKETFLTMDIYMRRTWNDPRLNYTYGPDSIVLHEAVVNQLVWVPDLFISNAIDVAMHEGVKPSYGFRLHANGDVMCSSRLSIKTHCDMDLRSFPMDYQQCNVDVESYMHTDDMIDLVWAPGAVQVSESATTPPAFVLLKVDHGRFVTVIGEKSFRKLRLMIHLKRLSSHYIVMTYIPCIFVVALSCLIFWMPVTSLGERAFYGAFLFLSTVALVASSQYGLPQVGYLKAIDIWGICCLAFVFCAVLEVMVLHLLRRGVADEDSANKLDQFELMKEDELSKLEQQPHLASNRALHPSTLRRVDLVFRVIYPAAFVLFNAIYWATYTN